MYILLSVQKVKIEFFRRCVVTGITEAFHLLLIHGIHSTLISYQFTFSIVYVALVTPNPSGISAPILTCSKAPLRFAMDTFCLELPRRKFSQSFHLFNRASIS